MHLDCWATQELVPSLQIIEILERMVSEVNPYLDNTYGLSCVHIAPVWTLDG